MSDSKCKRNVVSQSVALNTTVEQVQRWGEDVSNNGLDVFLWPLKKSSDFSSVIGSRQILYLGFLFDQSYLFCEIVISLGNSADRHKTYRRIAKRLFE